MKSFLTEWFMKFKLNVSLEEAERLQSSTLNLQSHGLTECPEFSTLLSIEYMESLRCLLMQYNQLEFFCRTSCRLLENLKCLAIDYNRLTDLPFCFRHLKNLSVLNVSHNNFSGLHFFHVICQIGTLKVLWANKTGLKLIPPEIKSLTNLRILGLRRNFIRALPSELFMLTNLRWLTLTGNMIEEIPFEVEGLKHLVHLNLQKNRIMRLPISFNHLQELQFLFLQYNFLIVDEGFIGFIASLPKLKKCVITGNLPDPSNSNHEPIHQIGRSHISSTMTPMTPWSGSGSPSPADSQRGPQSHPSNINLVQDPVDNQRNSISHVTNSDGHRRAANPMIDVDVEPPPLCCHRRPDYHLPDLDPGSVSNTHDLQTVYRTDRSHFHVSAPPTVAETGTFSEDSSEEILGNNNAETVLNRRVGNISGNPSQQLEINRSDVSRHGQSASPYNLMFVSSERFPTSRSGVVELISEQIPSGNNNSVPDQNCNTVRNPCTRIYRQLRTEQWVSDLQEQCEEEEQTELTGENEKTIREGDSHCTLNSAAEGEAPEVIERIKAKVDDIIMNAVKETSTTWNTTTSIPLLARRSTIYLVSETGGEKTEVGSATLYIRRAESNFDIGRTHVPIPSHDHNHARPENTESMILAAAVASLSGSNGLHITESGETHAMINSSVGTDAEATINDSSIGLNAFSSRLDLVDIESNYDPSEWEYSAPSSAIDDQDLAPKFGDPQDIGQELIEDDIEMPALTHEEVFKVLPILLIQ